MRDFSLPRPVDLVLAEFASLNNLADRRDLPRVFNAVARALGDRGWFCFDVNTPLSLRTQYPQTYWIEDKRFKLVQHGSVEADGRRARLDFEWLVPSGRMCVTCERRSGTSAGPTPKSAERSRSPGSISFGVRRPRGATEDAWEKRGTDTSISRPQT